MVAAPIAESVVKTILATDKMIEYCALVDADGKIEAGGIRRGFGEEDVASVPPRHDAWVVGDEPTVGIELIGRESPLRGEEGPRRQRRGLSESAPVCGDKLRVGNT
ncbi:MAG TPA: hypothetical protein VND40_00850 [Nitrososphaerales archaeon]|nr:hypothetical protein [Nitrososphaerales archaeon]